jgi:hypothetical protein
MNRYETMPKDLPKPIDDGACDHLIGTKLPNIGLIATDGSIVNLSAQLRKTVVYCYPMTGKPGSLADPLASYTEVPLGTFTITFSG